MMTLTMTMMMAMTIANTVLIKKGAVLRYKIAAVYPSYHFIKQFE